MFDSKMQVLLEEIGLLLVLFQVDEHATTRVAVVSFVLNDHGEGGLHLLLLGRTGKGLDRVIQMGLREILNVIGFIDT